MFLLASLFLVSLPVVTKSVPNKQQNNCHRNSQGIDPTVQPPTRPEQTFDVVRPEGLCGVGCAPPTGIKSQICLVS